MVVGDGFEPSKAWPVDLQSTAFDRSATPPERICIFRSGTSWTYLTAFSMEVKHVSPGKNGNMELHVKELHSQPARIKYGLCRAEPEIGWNHGKT